MRKKKYSHHIGVLLSESMYDELVRITDAREIGISEYVRDLVAENLKSLGEKENKACKRTNGMDKPRNPNSGGSKNVLD